jgi:hypothetical protein
MATPAQKGVLPRALCDCIATDDGKPASKTTRTCHQQQNSFYDFSMQTPVSAALSTALFLVLQV